MFSTDESSFFWWRSRRDGGNGDGGNSGGRSGGVETSDTTNRNLHGGCVIFLVYTELNSVKQTDYCITECFMEYVFVKLESLKQTTNMVIFYRHFNGDFDHFFMATSSTNDKQKTRKFRSSIVRWGNKVHSLYFRIIFRFMQSYNS